MIRRYFRLGASVFRMSVDAYACVSHQWHHSACARAYAPQMAMLMPKRRGEGGCEEVIFDQVRVCLGIVFVALCLCGR